MSVEIQLLFSDKSGLEYTMYILQHCYYMKWYSWFMSSIKVPRGTKCSGPDSEVCQLLNQGATFESAYSETLVVIPTNVSSVVNLSFIYCNYLTFCERFNNLCKACDAQTIVLGCGVSCLGIAKIAFRTITVILKNQLINFDQITVCSSL